MIEKRFQSAPQNYESGEEVKRSMTMNNIPLPGGAPIRRSDSHASLGKSQSAVVSNGGGFTSP